MRPQRQGLRLGSNQDWRMASVQAYGDWGILPGWKKNLVLMKK